IKSVVNGFVPATIRAFNKAWISQTSAHWAKYALYEASERTSGPRRPSGRKSASISNTGSKTIGGRVGIFMELIRALATSTAKRGASAGATSWAAWWTDITSRAEP